MFCTRVYACMALLVALSASPKANAILLHAPEISIDPNSNALSRLRVRYVASAFALSDSEAAVDTVDKIPLSKGDSLSRAGQVVADSQRGSTHHSEAEFGGFAQVGTLKGLTRARVENAAPNASADVYMQFMDVVQITEGGKLDYFFNASGFVKDQIHPSNVSVAAASIARV